MTKGFVFVAGFLLAVFIEIGWSASVQNDFFFAPKAKKSWYQRPKPRPRNTKFDLVFLLDSSNVGRYNFKREKGFVISLLEYFSVFSANTRVAVVSYNNNVTVDFDFKRYVNKECMVKKIKSLSTLGGRADYAKALEFVRTDLIHNNSTGARAGAEKVIFLLITRRHYRSSLKAIKFAYKLKYKGVKIVVLDLTRSRFWDNFMVGNGRKRSRFRGRYRYHRYGYWGASYGLRRIASGPQYLLSGHSYRIVNRVRDLLRLERPPRCYSEGHVVDECGRRCKCVHGRLVECCRLRKEFLDMTTAERVRYINTVKKASKDPAYKERYEKLLTLHRVIFDSNIHELEYFLPWHRWFILQYENLLREIDCHITVPYWDWSLTGADPLSSDVWNPGPHGFGGDGNGSRICVDTGPFREGVWSLIQSAGGGCLRRQFNGRTPNAVAVKMLIMFTPNPSDFENFEFLLRTEFHDLVHCVIFGTMCTIDSASAPEFFLHHGFVDKIWWDWEKQGKNHTFHEYFVSQTTRMPSTIYRSEDFLDLNNQPGCVCAEYVPSRSKIYSALQKAGRKELASIKRLPMPKFPESARKLFKITDKEMHRLHRLLKKMEPHEMLKKASLHGRDKNLGFETAAILKKDKGKTA
ncbi:uncharacterized protein LOC114528447 [Dendronephthya gigantea]|uniref:uncharacterized protein LOC114528447 n=1 Tax=Dendronephthya gigantea TaxID=151771 RepID=UPI00106D29BD|nr:uncharacterized protein LOC114528447 [Dendronephthya gigantea]